MSEIVAKMGLASNKPYGNFTGVSGMPQIGQAIGAPPTPLGNTGKIRNLVECLHKESADLSQALSVLEDYLAIITIPAVPMEAREKVKSESGSTLEEQLLNLGAGLQHLKYRIEDLTSRLRL